MESKRYDCAIVGGGVAGLALAILLAKAQKKVIVFEKETYPFHKVCGEYISSESLPFLSSLGLDLKAMNLPVITQLLLSSPSGIGIQRPLDIGGTGLSRYEMDLALYRLALEAGAEIRTGSKVQHLHFTGSFFNVVANDEKTEAKVAVGAFGKLANLDVQLGRNYKAKEEKDLFIAVKHQVRAAFDSSRVEIHNFNGGYCGMSAIEDGKVNLSYICRAEHLKKYRNIAAVEKKVLSQNPFLGNYFTNAEFLFGKPLTISHLYFQVKEPVTNSILMLGDAAGNIAPLSGNGMSIALQSAMLAAQEVAAHLDGRSSFAQMTQNYAAAYHQAFNRRIGLARHIHTSFGSPRLTNLAFLFLKVFPRLIDVAGAQIHGEVF